MRQSLFIFVEFGLLTWLYILDNINNNISNIDKCINGGLFCPYVITII